MRRIQTKSPLELWANAPICMFECEGTTIVVVGTLINRMTNRPIKTNDPIPLSRDAATWLIKDCWGAYVAFLIDKHNAISVIRDPSGLLPCYQGRADDAFVFVSDPAFFASAGSPRPVVDWTSLKRHLRARDLRTPLTCLYNIQEVMPGTSMETDTPDAAKAVWSPWDHVTPRLDDEMDLAKALRHAVRQSVSAMTPGNGQVLLGISGGLDSSIVAACLGDRATYYTMATEGGVGDERWLARLLAKHQSRTLREFVFNLSDIDIHSSASRCLARPTRLPFQQAIDHAVSMLLDGGHFEAVFNGNGGDNIFCALTSASPLVDRYRAEGFGQGTIETLLDISNLAGASLWTVGKKATAQGRRSNAYIWKGDDRFLRESSDTIFEHPWLNCPPSALPGKAAHIALLLRIQNYVEGPRYGHLPPVVSPLLAQPVVELCLSVPTWHWCRRGRNRSLARLAFGDVLPFEIMHRKAKGAPDSFSMEILEVHRRVVREGLLDGLLASKGIIDRDAIAKALKGQNELLPDISLRLSTLWEAELWSRAWTR